MGLQDNTEVSNPRNLVRLAFGIEAVALVEIGLKSLRIELAAVEHNDKALRLNLDLLDEKRE